MRGSFIGVPLLQPIRPARAPQSFCDKLCSLSSCLSLLNARNWNVSSKSIHRVEEPLSSNATSPPNRRLSYFPSDRCNAVWYLAHPSSEFTLRVVTGQKFPAGQFFPHRGGSDSAEGRPTACATCFHARRARLCSGSHSLGRL